MCHEEICLMVVLLCVCVVQVEMPWQCVRKFLASTMDSRSSGLRGLSESRSHGVAMESEN